MIKISTPLNQVDTTPLLTVGSQVAVRDAEFDSLNTYEYRPGTTSGSGTIYQVCAWSSTGSTTSVITTTRGMVGISAGTISAAKYGWYLVNGIGWANCGAKVAGSGSAIYASGTAGGVTDRGAAGAWITGMVSSAAGVSGGTVKVFLSYPSLDGVA